MSDRIDTNREAQGTPSAPEIRGQAGGLPLQNLLLAAAAIGAVGGLAQWLNIQIGLPFGRGHFVEAVGPAGTIGWSAGLVLAAVVALLGARGVAKLLLLPRRRSGYYGYWLVALSASLGTLPLVGLDLLATRVTHWWHWDSSAWQWEGIALPNLGGWLLVNLLALLLATPALIDKRPVQSPPRLLSLEVWFTMNAVCLAGCVSRVGDAALAVLAAPALIVTMVAFQQHRAAVRSETSRLDAGNADAKHPGACDSGVTPHSNT